MAHATMTAFGYPELLIREYDHWTVQLRPKQATLGALVLIAKAEVTAFAELPDAAFTELAQPVRDIQLALHALFGPDQLNYLKLMMVDPHVHDHVLPRYSGTRTYRGAGFTDPGWPGPPQIAHDNAVDAAVRDGLLADLRAAWPA